MPSFTFSKQKRSASFIKRTSSPSIIAYEYRITNASTMNNWVHQSRIKASPSASIGKAKRLSTQNAVIPGPGAYELAKYVEKSEAVSMKGTKNIKMHTEGPGPCAYNPNANAFFPQKRFTFPKTTNASLEKKIGPDPQTYKLKEQRDQSAPIFPKGERQGLIDPEKAKLPGPGQYSRDQLLKETKNKFTFFKTKKFKEEQIQLHQKQQTPGPGKYDISKARTLFLNGKFTKSMRRCFDDDSNPGPSDYNLNSSMLSHCGGVMPKQKRSFNYEKKVPGPGSYKEVALDFVKMRAHTMIMTKSSKDSFNNTSIGHFNSKDKDREHFNKTAGR